MKKIVALLLALIIVSSLTMTALAAGEKTGTTKLTVVVPGFDYTIHVPADVTLEYNNTSDQTIGDVYVSDVPGVCTIYFKTTITDLSNGSSTIPVTYSAWLHGTALSFSNGTIKQVYETDGTNTEDWTWTITARISASDWLAAAPGTYTATMTFNFYLG